MKELNSQLLKTRGIIKSRGVFRITSNIKVFFAKSSILDVSQNPEYDSEEV